MFNRRSNLKIYRGRHVNVWHFIVVLNMIIVLFPLTVAGAGADEFLMFREYLVSHTVNEYFCSSELYPAAVERQLGFEEEIVVDTYCTNLDSDEEYELCLVGPGASGNHYLSILDIQNGQVNCVVNEWGTIWGHYYLEEAYDPLVVIIEGNGMMGDSHFQLAGYDGDWNRQVLLEQLITSQDEEDAIFYDGMTGYYVDHDQYTQEETAIREQCISVESQIQMPVQQPVSIEAVCEWLNECSEMFGESVVNDGQSVETDSSDYAFGVSEANEDTWFYITSTYKKGIALHPEPDPDSEVLNRLPHLTVFHGSEFSGTYVLTEYGGQVGWLNTKYAKEITLPEDRDDTFPVEGWYQITSTYEKGIAIHPVPSKESEVLGRIPYLGEFYVESGCDNYGFTSFGDTVGWINLDYARPLLDYAEPLNGENNEQVDVLDSVEIVSSDIETHESYLLPDSGVRVYSESELRQLPLQILNYARNEIFAKYGRRFQSQELMDYFNAMPWYSGTISPESFDANVLNAIEKQNVQTMHNIEYADGVGYQLDQQGYDISLAFSYLNKASEGNSTSYAGTEDGASNAGQIDYLSIYGPILEKGYDPTHTLGEYREFCIYDIDGDGIEELIGETNYNNVVIVYTIVGGEARQILEYYGKVRGDYGSYVQYSEEFQALILFNHGGTGMGGYDMYVKNGLSMDLIRSIYTYSVVDGITFVRQAYEVNDEEVSEDRYRSEYAEYYENSLKLYLCENTWENRMAILA